MIVTGTDANWKAARETRDTQIGNILSTASTVRGEVPQPRRINAVATSNTLTNSELRSLQKTGDTGSQIMYTDPKIFGPLFDPVNWYLPYSYRVLNRWIRYYDRFHPMVGNAIDMHSTIPLSRFSLSDIDDDQILQEFEDVVEEMELFGTFLEIAREYWLLGECYPFSHWNDEDACFDEVVLLNPDFVMVNAHPLAWGEGMTFELEPDDVLKHVVNAPDAIAQEIRGSLPDEIIQAVQAGTNIPLDGRCVSQIARKASPYDIRGTSIVLRCFTPDTPVLTDLDEWVPIGDLKEGSTVIDGAGKSTTVTAVLPREVDEEIVEVKVLGNEPFRCSKEHPFLVWRVGETCACGCGRRLEQGKRWHYVFYDRSCIWNVLRGAKGGDGEALREVIKQHMGDPYVWRPASELEPGDVVLRVSKVDGKEPFWSYARVGGSSRVGEDSVIKRRPRMCPADYSDLDSFIYTLVEDVTTVHYEGTLIDIEVESEEHSFCVGSGIIVHNCIKDLLYEDKLRQAQYSVADRHITPLQVYRLGDPKEDILPTQAQIDEFASLLASGSDDPNFAIVGHYGLQVEYIGSTGKILPIVPEFEFVEKRLLTALFTNKAMTASEGPSYANASIAFEVLQLRYLAFRGLLEVWAKRKLFKPIAEERGYRQIPPADLAHRVRTTRKSMDRQLVLPDFNWLGKMQLRDESQYQSFILRLRERADVPLSTVCEVFNLDYNEIKSGLLSERGTIADPQWRDALSRGVSEAWRAPVGPGAVPGAAPGAAPGVGGPPPGAGGPSPGAGGPSPSAVVPLTVAPGVGGPSESPPTTSPAPAPAPAAAASLESSEVDKRRRVFGFNGVHRKKDTSFYTMAPGREAF